MIRTYTIHSPLRVPQSKTKDFILNLNNYRNAHYHTLNTAKRRYKAAIDSQVQQLPQMQTIALLYVLYPGSRRRTDLANVISIHQKFFEDALVEAGKLPDDDYAHLLESGMAFGHVDKGDPRVTIEILHRS